MSARRSVVAYSLKDAEAVLREEGREYRLEHVRPTRNFFPLDSDRIYVIREKILPDGSSLLTLANALLKGGVKDGV